MLQNLTILHVEDNILIQEYIQTLLENKVKKIYFATNGKEGLEIYFKTQPDIVIADIEMPICDGMTMIKEIKKFNKEQHIILLSGCNDEKTLIKAINLGVNGFISKPIEENNCFDVLSKAEQAISLRRNLLELNDIEKDKKKVYLMSDLIDEISHHWRQPLSVILMISSSYEVKKRASYYKTIEDEIDEISRISKEVTKLVNVLNKLDNIEFNRFFIEQVQETVKISQPLYKNK